MGTTSTKSALGLVLTAIGLLTATPALGQSSNNPCIRQTIGGNPSCTANDVRIGHMQLIAGPSSCDPSDTTPFAVTIEATIESGPDRWDIGLWFNTAGNSAKDDPSGNNCYRDYLHPIDGLTNCQQQGGPYYNQDNDSCGDVYAQNTNPCGNAVTAPCTSGMGGTCLFSKFTFTTMITCTDSNADNIVDTGTCTSWDNMPGAVCVNELSTNPGTGSKCDCNTTNIVGLSVPPTTTTTSTTTSTTTTSSTTTSSTTTSSTTTSSTTTSSTTTSSTTTSSTTTSSTTTSSTSTTETTTTSTTTTSSTTTSSTTTSSTTTSSTTTSSTTTSSTTTSSTTSTTATTTTSTTTTSSTTTSSTTTSSTTSSTTTTTAPCGTETDCDNMQNDDPECDDLTDCMDPDCTNVTPCRPARKDPTLIRFGSGDLDLLKGHATLDMAPVDVNAVSVGVLLANPSGTLYSGTLPPGSFTVSPTGTMFRYRNLDARYTGGFYSVKIKQRRDGSAYVFNFTAYANLEAATDPLMRLQFYIGIGQAGERPFITIDTPWTQTSNGWRAPKDH